MSVPPVGASDLYLTEQLLSEDELAVRDRVRAFCDDDVRPIINRYWDRAEFPFELLPKLARLGICGGMLKGHGCPGLSAVASGLVAMELGRGDGSISTFHGVHSGLTMTAVGLLGSEEQRERWLPRMATLDLVGAFALTEPDHGSDAVALEATARRDGDEWVIDGQKRWIGNASFADLVVVWARIDGKRVGAFVVEKDAPGFEARLITGKIAKRASWQTDITLTEVRVPEENRLPDAETFDDATRVLTYARPNVAWGALGHATAAYELAVAYVAERKVFGKHLDEFQLTQYRLAKMLGELTGMRLLCLRLAQLTDAGASSPAIASLAKMSSAAAARRVVSDARDLLGGNGLLLEHEVGRHLGDSEVTYTVEGTDTVQALIVGREITGRSAFT